MTMRLQQQRYEQCRTLVKKSFLLTYRFGSVILQATEQEDLQRSCQTRCVLVSAVVMVFVRKEFASATKITHLQIALLTNQKDQKLNHYR